MDITKWGIESVLYPLMEARRGNRVRPFMEELKTSEKLSEGGLKTLRREKLLKLLFHCIENVPAYRSFKDLRGEIEACPETALRRFPILSKKDYMTRPGDFIAEGVSTSALIENRTGGSTGEPVKFHMDRRTVEYYEAARWRGLSWYGITPGSRSVMIWGNPFELTRGAQRSYALKERYLKNRIIISAYDIDPKKIGEIAAGIDRFHPEYLYGYPSPMATVARLMLEKGLSLKTRLKGVVSTAETLSPEYRDIIEKAFAARVINEYGARDAGILAYECPEGGMHITAENVFLEVIHPGTGDAFNAGEFGALLATDLNNFSEPRLRYRLGDTAVLSGGTCYCGRCLPLIEELSGREDSMFIRTDGSFVHGNAFTQLARSMDFIERFQIVQKSPERAVLKVVFRPGGRDIEKNLSLLAGRAEKLLPGTKVEAVVVDDIPVSGSGKFRSSIREFTE